MENPQIRESKSVCEGQILICLNFFLAWKHEIFPNQRPIISVFSKDPTAMKYYQINFQVRSFTLNCLQSLFPNLLKHGQVH